jgi:hypothetical protein
MTIYEKLSKIQQKLKAPKGQYNSFGGYKYRSAEDILEAVKPICAEFETVLILTDSVVQVGDRIYVKAEAELANFSGEDSITASAFAREPEDKKGMDSSQITGTASSYARKYALNGLFNIDDTKDADTDEYQKQTRRSTSSGSKKVNATQVQQIKDLVAVKGADEIELYTRYGVGDFSQLTREDGRKLYNELKSM